MPTIRPERGLEARPDPCLKRRIDRNIRPAYPLHELTSSGSDRRRNYAGQGDISLDFSRIRRNCISLLKGPANPKHAIEEAVKIRAWRRPRDVCRHPRPHECREIRSHEKANGFARRTLRPEQ